MESARISGAGYREIAETLRDSINSGELAPGTQLPAEMEVCRRWGVSRVTARRALASLEADGLADSIQGRGRFVKGPEGTRTTGSRAEAIAAEIRGDVTAGRLSPGDRIASEAALSERHGVARGTAREALLILDREGLTTVVAGRGRFVAAPDEQLLDNRAEEIARDLRTQIATQQLAPGDSLAGEGELASVYGAARGTVRRALEMLELEGIVNRVPGRSRVVADVKETQ
ncbi:GntR family transcriptional regulator [Couchioplanes caeruleus]|uniref:HTH gntR-type domain-containing protein n=1 Tax=Couchioplanes caeruleus subsp. caeruleus TaxID=56427 RepID=A0A1K0GSU5_9ACTN|nr:GntR family transcriptional regulator [Couchioplanes caeruleus]OJF15510.1 hypothetical protein BG844_03985 [Couchioplanes caeruleus subsp. caeruleus]